MAFRVMYVPTSDVSGSEVPQDRLMRVTWGYQDGQNGGPVYTLAVSQDEAEEFDRLTRAFRERAVELHQGTMAPPVRWTDDSGVPLPWIAPTFPALEAGASDREALEVTSDREAPEVTSDRGADRVTTPAFVSPREEPRETLPAGAPRVDERTKEGRAAIRAWAQKNWQNLGLPQPFGTRGVIPPWLTEAFHQHDNGRKRVSASFQRPA